MNIFFYIIIKYIYHVFILFNVLIIFNNIYEIWAFMSNIMLIILIIILIYIHMF